MSCLQQQTPLNRLQEASQATALLLLLDAVVHYVHPSMLCHTTSSSNRHLGESTTAVAQALNGAFQQMLVPHRMPSNSILLLQEAAACSGSSGNSKPCSTIRIKSNPGSSNSISFQNKHALKCQRRMSNHGGGSSNSFSNGAGTTSSSRSSIVTCQRCICSSSKRLLEGKQVNSIPTPNLTLQLPTGGPTAGHPSHCVLHDPGQQVPVVLQMLQQAAGQARLQLAARQQEKLPRQVASRARQALSSSSRVQMLSGSL
jgi:hypothetical protein